MGARYIPALNALRGSIWLMDGTAWVQRADVRVSRRCHLPRGLAATCGHARHRLHSPLCAAPLPHTAACAHEHADTHKNTQHAHNARRHASTRAHTKHGKHIRRPALAHRVLACALAAHSRPCCAVCALRMLYGACYILHVARCWTACVNTRMIRRTPAVRGADGTASVVAHQ